MTAGRVIVGNSYLVDRSTQHAFVYNDGQMIDLNDLIPLDTGWVVTLAEDIKNVGQIVGYGKNPAGQTRAFLLTPVDSPAMGRPMGAVAAVTVASQGNDAVGCMYTGPEIEAGPFAQPVSQFVDVPSRPTVTTYVSAPSGATALHGGGSDSAVFSPMTDSLELPGADPAQTVADHLLAT
jgi:probable HAF family extracellular repeat protein